MATRPQRQKGDSAALGDGVQMLGGIAGLAVTDLHPNAATIGKEPFPTRSFHLELLTGFRVTCRYRRYVCFAIPGRLARLTEVWLSRASAP